MANCPKCKHETIVVKKKKGGYMETCPKSMDGCGWWTNAKKAEYEAQQPGEVSEVPATPPTPAPDAGAGAIDPALERLDGQREEPVLDDGGEGDGTPRRFRGFLRNAGLIRE